MWKEDLYYCQEAMSSRSPLSLTMSGITYCDGTYRVIRENSPFYLFEYIIKGRGYVKVGDSSFVPGEGDVYILHGGSSYEYYSSADDPWTKTWFTMTGDLAPHLIQVYGLSGVHHVQKVQVRPYFEKLMNILKYPHPGGRFDETALLFHELLIHIASAAARSLPDHSPASLEIRRYLDSRIEEPVRLAGLSERFGKSPSQIIRLFKKEFHTTPYEYLMNLRIETAKHLLHNTNCSVKEIALRLQFADEHYFSHYFKSRVGLAPTKFKVSGPIRYM